MQYAARFDFWLATTGSPLAAAHHLLGEIVVAEQPAAVTTRQPSNDTTPLDEVTRFLDEEIHHVPGAMVRLAHVRARYEEWCQQHGHRPVSVAALRSAVSARLPVGKPCGANLFVGNASFNVGTRPRNPTPFVLDGDRLRRDYATVASDGATATSRPAEASERSPAANLPA